MSGMSHEVSVSEIETHRGNVQSISGAVSSTAASAKGTGIGDTALYGIIGQAILPPMMDPTLKAASGAIGELDKLLQEVVVGLGETVSAYSTTEQTNAQGSTSIGSW